MGKYDNNERGKEEKVEKTDIDNDDIQKQTNKL